ncbi:MAG: hypothetical protein PHP95_12065 [Desulfuromonadaceae bacterium]|nr:hypothetical protein [Desulfuromonadaceae bacterium]MDD2849181.1 hypothetical protein [Desulfuromonadaceae bacterium]MDD4129770.1 hypothetical protein [Desulfuromonadaceae bacterium]
MGIVTLQVIAIAACLGVVRAKQRIYMKSTRHSFLIAFPFMNYVLLLPVLVLTGCATISLSDWQTEYKEINQQSIDFNDNSSVKADYLGKQKKEYIYRVIDSNNQELLFHLPAQKEFDQYVTVHLDNNDNLKPTGNTVIFHFSSNPEQQLVTDTVSDHPKNINIYGKFKDSYHLLAGSGNKIHSIKDTDKIIKYQYSCKEVDFSTGVKQQGDISDIKLGLSATNTTILTLSNLGYIVTYPLDFVTFPLQLFILTSGLERLSH